jgi:hypothetical protein
MSSCKKATTKKYLKRKGPPYHAKDCKGSVKSGNDGKLYISSPDKRGVYKWVLNNKNKTKKVKPAHDASIKTYKIHDNGAVPYIAMIKPKSRIEVYSTNKKVVDIEYTQLFVGDNLLPYPLAVKKGKAIGNSLLIKTGVNKYIYVGSEIYSIETKEEIKKYYSPVGNSDVPYPYAVGDNLTYFMLDKKTLPNELLDLKKDGYEQFYGHTIKDEKEIKKMEKAKKHFKVKMIHKHIL